MKMIITFKMRNYRIWRKIRFSHEDVFSTHGSLVSRTVSSCLKEIPILSQNVRIITRFTIMFRAICQMTSNVFVSTKFKHWKLCHYSSRSNFSTSTDFVLIENLSMTIILRNHLISGNDKFPVWQSEKKRNSVHFLEKWIWVKFVK